MLSHSVLLVVGGALLTGLLGALVFGSSGTAEEKRMREQQKLLRALEAQRRIRAAQLMREARRREPSARVHVEVEPEPKALEPTPDEMHELRSAREAEKRAQRRAEQERKSAARAERATLRAAEQQRTRDEKKKAAVLKAERDAAKAREREAREEAVARKDELETRVADEQPAEPDAGKPLSELPLYSWAIEAEDRDSAS
jgi:hypothetical protein